MGFVQEQCEDDVAVCGADLLWRWLEQRLNSNSAPDVMSLREVFANRKDRMRLLVTLSEKTLGQVEGLHLTVAALDSRVADATLPLLAHFDEFKETLPSKADVDALDLLQLPGFLSFIDVGHLLRHQVVALLACVLLSIPADRRRGWCRLVGFTIEVDMLEVAGRLWDVHTVKDSCQWDISGGLEDRETVLEAGDY